MAIKTVEQGSAEIFRKTINDNFSELEVLSGNGPPPFFILFFAFCTHFIFYFYS